MTQEQITKLEAFLKQEPFRTAVCVKKEESLARNCTFRIGGESDYFLVPQNAEAFCALFRFLKAEKIRCFLLGRGSNLLFDDAGYRGVIVSTAGLNQITCEGSEIAAGAGVTVMALSSAAAKAGLTGMEFLYGIPGSVGGAVYMNAGAYGGEMAQILQSVRCLDLASGEIVTFSAEECEFAYRHSRFMQKKWAILSAKFHLQFGDAEQIRLQMEELMRRRIEKQPLNYPSAGSTFKRYPGKFTAQMIDQAGLKGVSIGKAQISEKHAGFLINLGGAASKDVLDLIELVKDRVEEIHGVRIECEVEYVPPQEEKEENAWS